MPLTWSRVRLGDRFVQRSQEPRVIFAAVIARARMALLLDKDRPRPHGQTAEFVRTQLRQFRFNFRKTHRRHSLYVLVWKGNTKQRGEKQKLGKRKAEIKKGPLTEKAEIGKAESANSKAEIGKAESRNYQSKS